MHWLRTTAITLLGLAFAGIAWAQADVVQVKRSTDLRQSPGESGAVIAPLAAQTNLTRLPERQGPWMRVKTEAGQTGWVHMFDIGTATASTAAGNSGAGALRGLASLFSRPAQQTTATSTIGIRGLGAEDLANAQPNAAAVTQMEALRTDGNQAKRFAADAQLSARDVEALPAPPAPVQATNLPQSQY